MGAMICSNAREGDHADDVRADVLAAAAAVFADFCGTDEMGSASVVPTIASIMASLSAAASFLCAAALAASDARYSASVIIAGEVLRTMDFVVEGGLATHHVAAYCNKKRQSAGFIIRRAFALADDDTISISRVMDASIRLRLIWKLEFRFWCFETRNKSGKALGKRID